MRTPNFSTPRLAGQSVIGVEPGDGIVQVRRIREAAEAAGYRGPVEVEIFNRELWALPGREAVRAVRGSFLTHA